MTNLEKTRALENKLNKSISKSRIIQAILLVFFITLIIVFSILRENSKVVTTIGEEWLSYTSVEYNNAFVPFIIIGAFGSLFVGIFLLGDFLSCRYVTTEANGSYITVYRGKIKCIAYINGAEIEKVYSYNRVIDTNLPNGVKVTISFYCSLFMIAHISYSDNNKSVDL